MDTNLYKHLNASQMKQVRLGLLSKVDVTIYNKREYAASQMMYIRLCLECNKDPSVLLRTIQEYDVIEEIFKGVMCNIDMSIFNDLNYSAITIKSYVSLLKNGIDSSKYLLMGFDRNQIQYILWGLEKELPVDIYADKSLPDYMMGDLYRDLKFYKKRGITIPYFKMPKPDRFILKEVADGIKKGIDLILYAEQGFSYEQIKEIRVGLEADLDPSLYAKLDYNHKIIHAKVSSLLNEQTSSDNMDLF